MRAVVDRIHRRGWQLFVWTVNRPAEMRRLIAWGVDGLITNHPDQALALIEIVGRSRALPPPSDGE